jgi:hypothetical protein
MHLFSSVALNLSFVSQGERQSFTDDGIPVQNIYVHDFNILSKWVHMLYHTVRPVRV